MRRTSFFFHSTFRKLVRGVHLPFKNVKVCERKSVGGRFKRPFRLEAMLIILPKCAKSSYIGYSRNLALFRNIFSISESFIGSYVDGYIHGFYIGEILLCWRKYISYIGSLDCIRVSVTIALAKLGLNIDQHFWFRSLRVSHFVSLLEALLDDNLHKFRCKENTDFALNCALLLGSVDETISTHRRHLAAKLRGAIIERESQMSRQNSTSSSHDFPNAPSETFNAKDPSSDNCQISFIENLVEIGRKLVSQPDRDSKTQRLG